MEAVAEFNWPVAAFAALWAIVIAVVGTRLTVIDEWYFSLKKPGWKPPDWSFGLIWTTVFILSGTALYRGWMLAPDSSVQWTIAILFVINGILNIGWNLLFFSMKRPDWALWETYGLIASVVIPALYLLQFDWIAAALLVPYALWVSIACYLTYEIVNMNQPFQGKAHET